MASPTTSAADLATLSQMLRSADTWLTLGITMVFGMLGGYAHKLVAPADDTTSDLGYAVLGAVGALGALFAVAPQDGLKLVGLAVIAGFAGKALMSALQARVEAAVAKTEAAKATVAKVEAIATGTAAVQRATNIVESVARGGRSLTAGLIEHQELTVKDALPSLADKASEIFSPYLTVNPATPLSSSSAESALADLAKLQGRLEGLAAGGIEA